MAGASPYPSLLSHLETGKGRFRLRIALLPNAHPALERGLSPFRVIAESGPFAQIIPGDIVTDAESPIRPVFLLRQPDQYRDLSDQIRPVVNPDVDRFWQEAYRWYRSGQNPAAPDALFLLAGQIDAEDRLLPCHSLFYCILRQVYFHPLCPQCGRVLELCRRDDALKAAGLKPYSDSLKRYLYCPDCAARPDGAAFYVFELQADDPPGLKDRGGLIQDFGNLLVKPDLEDHLPCSGCAEQIACYGPQDLCQQRIVPFGFYPFNLMMFEAATVHAMDFVALLSGATPNRLKEHVTDLGRRYALEAASSKLSGSSRFLFNDSDSSHFLEILYLKLSFLGEFSVWSLASESSPVYPDLALSLNRVWVQLPDQAGLLPSLWNFKPMRFDVGLPDYGRSEALRHASASGLYGLAMTWFYTLLVNQHQGIREVSEILEQLCDKLFLAAEPASPLLFQEIDAGAFRPENTFWDPAGYPVEPRYESLWHEALNLGASLLRAGLDRELPWSQEAFNQRFDALRQSVRGQLFSAAQPAETSETSGQDRAIVHILENLSRKWRFEMRQPPVAEDLEATILMAKQAPAGNDPPVAHPQTNDDLQETVILPQKPSVRQPVEQPRTTDDEKTVILPVRPPGSQPATDSEPPQDDLVQETVLLTSRELTPEQTGPKPAPPRRAEPADPETMTRSPAEEYLETTIIQRPPDSGAAKDRDLEETVVTKAPAHEDKRSGPDTEDDLAETVIMKPKPGKSK